MREYVGWKHLKTVANKGFLLGGPDFLNLFVKSIKSDLRHTKNLCRKLDRPCYDVIGFRHVEVKEERRQVPYPLLLRLLPRLEEQQGGA
jgi:hypothetical protein